MKTTIHRGFAAMQIAALLAAMGAAAFPLAANATAFPQCDNETSTHFYSQDAGTTVSPDAHAAVPVSSLNAAWTATPTIPGASWIWGEDPTADTVTGSVETFTRTFNVTGTPQLSLIQIAADNGYSVKVNGNSIGADAEEFNYQLGHQDMYQIPAADLNTGANTLEITVTNMPLENGTPATNPGGLLYDLNVNTCPPPPPPPTDNTCALPTGADADNHVDIGSPDGSEKSVQATLTDAGYSLDADTDQQNSQEWDGSNNTVHFSVTYLKKQAGDTHTFGYYANATSTFVPLFRDGTDPSYSSVPLQSPNDTVDFDISGLNNVVFAIVDYNGSAHTIYTTKSSLNSGVQHDVVYNPSTNEYVISFEDRPLDSSKDFNDLLLKLKVTGCDNPDTDTATIVATKIVCDSESDLPNWGAGNGPDIDGDTAANFLENHSESCHLEPGWTFETAPSNTANPGDNIGAAGGSWTPFGPTDGSGVVSTTVPASGYVWVREQMNDDYVPFSYNLDPEHPNSNANDVSAELYCSTDHLNYDNWDRVDDLQAGHTYYCVAFNAPKEKAPVCDADAAKVNLLQNPSFEAPTVSNAAKWDIFPSGTPGLAWNVAWYGGSPTYESHNRPETANAELQTNGLLGITASDGSQWTELDADWDGPSGSLTGEPASVTLSQDVPTVPGTKYTVSYDFMPRPSTAGADNKVEALADGTVESSADASSGSGWTTHAYTFTATNSTTTIAFRDAGTPGDALGTLIDNASMNCVPPEEEQCPVGQHYNSDHRCVPDENDNGGADVSVAKTVVVAGSGDQEQPDVVNPKDELVYTIEVNNAGPDTATNIVVSDTLPDGLTFVSANAPTGDVATTSAPVTVTWSIPSLDNDASVSISIHATVNENDEDGDAIENTATVVSNDDPNDGNDSSSAEVTVEKPDNGGGTTLKIQHHSSSRPGGSVAGAFAAIPQVLGESCGLYMEKYLKPGSPKNDPDQVMKLQVFLNKWMGSTLPITGYYGPLTIAALNGFQQKYADQILTPWGIQGPTSLVYLSTLREINLLECPALSLQLPELVPWSQNPNAQ